MKEIGTQIVANTYTSFLLPFQMADYVFFRTHLLEP